MALLPFIWQMDDNISDVAQKNSSEQNSLTNSGLRPMIRDGILDSSSLLCKIDMCRLSSLQDYPDLIWFSLICLSEPPQKS